MTAACGPDRPEGPDGPASALPPGSLVGTECEVQVGPVAHGGHFVARHQGRVVFVRHALPGERVRVRVTDGVEGDRFLRADAVEVHVASPQRVAAPCAYAGAGRCGGCDFQHVSLAYQRTLKAAVVREQFQHLAGLDVDVEVEPVPGDEDGLRWRTRVEFAVDERGRAGLRAHRSHRVLPVADCLITRPAIIGSGVLGAVWEGCSAVVAVESDDQPGTVLLPVPGGDAPQVVHRVETGEWAGELAVSARGFWQVHPGAAATFLAHVMAQLAVQRGERALDLYAGAGLFALALADAVGRDGAVLAVESDRRAVEDGIRNAASRPQVRFRAGRVERVLGNLVRQGEHADVVVLDPPRAGAGARVVRAVRALRPRAIAYVGCDPAALARDTAYLRDAGYRMRSLRAFDAFPMTHHVECIAVFARSAPSPSPPDSAAVGSDGNRLDTADEPVGGMVQLS